MRITSSVNISNCWITAACKLVLFDCVSYFLIQKNRLRQDFSINLGVACELICNLRCWTLIKARIEKMCYQKTKKPQDCWCSFKCWTSNTRPYYFKHQRREYSSNRALFSVFYSNIWLAFIKHRYKLILVFVDFENLWSCEKHWNRSTILTLNSLNKHVDTWRGCAIKCTTYITHGWLQRTSRTRPLGVEYHEPDSNSTGRFIYQQFNLFLWAFQCNPANMNNSSHRPNYPEAIDQSIQSQT